MTDAQGSLGELVALLQERSVRTGSFVLASGRRSDLYVDARQTTLHARGAALVGELVLRQLRPEVAGVGGLTLGADPIASAAAALSHGVLGRPVHAFLIRKAAKEHGTGQRVEGLGNLTAGDAVCVVEDTTTTGGSLLDAVAAAREVGLRVVQCLTVVDREEGAAERLAAEGLTLEALVRRSDLVGSAAPE
ncbi:MAG: orotate phosphoribosyltransferase [Myxococcota bacterium]